MVGYDDWDEHEFEVVQNGSHSWEGIVKVWSEYGSPYGGKLEEAAPGDWEISDTITLKSCSNPGKMSCLHFKIFLSFLLFSRFIFI